ncbi:protein-lysine N-methyltransferase EEF2KMT isoform X2 [Oenanthe melanoleuca]|uniref:protein-lysine N-methyltransferase EEF2KMT isoform X2 n=1 Tax=Oenanthe melanoleuca TaxID=2939378 RepID=UPI0024C1DBCA|nr:protein-lysine N-methyltransferase EEF2KMT isoform X2 [Oenanthe melanoleuca]
MFVFPVPGVCFPAPGVCSPVPDVLFPVPGVYSPLPVFVPPFPVFVFPVPARAWRPLPAGALTRGSRSVSRGSRIRSSLRRSLVRAAAGRCRSALWAAPPAGTAPGEAGDSRPALPGRALRGHGRAAAGAGAALPAPVPGGAAAPLAALAGARAMSADRAGPRAAGGYSAQGEDSSESPPCHLRAVSQSRRNGSEIRRAVTRCRSVSKGSTELQTILHPLCVKYPPSAKYRRCFLTELIKKLESTAAEPLDELYEALADVLKEEESTHCYKNYLLPTGDCVSLSESTALISGGTTGLVTWEAALLLAQWALQNPAVFRDRTILELGSGIGFTGIAICKTCQPRTFIFSDCHPRVLRQLGENIRLNGFIPEPDVPWSIQTEPQGQELEGESCQNPKVIVAELDWGSVTEEQLLGLRADVVIAADVVYDPEIILALIGMLQKLSTCRADRRAPEVFIASTIRNPDTYQLFQDELDKAGIRWQMIPAHSCCNFLYDVQPDVTILQLFI